MQYIWRCRTAAAVEDDCSGKSLMSVADTVRFVGEHYLIEEFEARMDRKPEDEALYAAADRLVTAHAKSVYMFHAVS